MWSTEYQRDINATPETIWRLFSDVPGWKAWNAGIEFIELHGPFKAGTTFTMRPPGQDAFISTLIDVRPNELFIDETKLGDVRVVVEHRIEPIASNQVVVRYRITVEGPDAAEVGAAVSADFPDVLSALSQRAESTH